MRNKPNSRGAAGAAGRLRKTNPIWASPPGIRGPVVRNKPNFGIGPAGGWGWLYETNPISSGQGVPLFQYSIIPPFQSLPVVRNKANFQGRLRRHGFGVRQRMPTRRRAAMPSGFG
jgi:hypothetical protein